MKISFTIEFTAADLLAGLPPKIRVEKPIKEAVAKVAKIAAVAPEPVPELPAPTTPEVGLKQNSGPQFDPGFLKVVMDAPEPFTRRSIAVSTGLKVEDVTQRFIRMAKKGWIEQPARELWKRTKTFGLKP